MKQKPSIIYLAVIGLLAASSARADRDSRFDGIWIGTETLTPISPLRPDQQKIIPPPYKINAIAQGGTQVGKIGGVCRGRYSRVRHSGDRLTIQAVECKRKLSLSADCKTLIEEGKYNFVTTYTVRTTVNPGSWPTSWRPLRITGTLFEGA